MDDDVREFGLKFGRSVLGQSWAEVHGMLAPWLRSAQSEDDVRRFFEDEYLATLRDNQIEELKYPEYPEPDLDGNAFTKATQLREPMSFAGGKVRPVAPEVTGTNMRYWMSMKLQCSDEQMAVLGFDHFCQVWIAVVDTPEGLRVGYWSQGAY